MYPAREGFYKVSNASYDLQLRAAGADPVRFKPMSSRVKSWILRTNRVVRAPHIELGELGERKAVDCLKSLHHYRIVATNYRVTLGRGLGGRKVTGEVDIVAYDGETLVFVEVKTRASDELAAPESAVNLRKQRQIARTARRYREMMRLVDEPYRYDVITLVRQGSNFNVDLHKGYFDDSVFRRARFFA